LATIQRLGLSVDQKLILIHDLHYSHKGVEVRDFCEANNIILIFIPAGCTDIIQMCDVGLNKTFKNGVLLAFVAYVNGKFTAHVESNPNDMFKLDLKLSVMKPLLPGFVKAGIAAMSTIAMKSVIRNCFLNNGMVKKAKTDAALVDGRALLAKDDTPTVGEEVDDDLGPVEEAGIDGEQEFEIEVDDAVDADEEVNGDEEVPLHALPNPIPEVAPQSALHPCIHVNINNPPTTRKPSYSYEMVNEDVWNDGGIVDSTNIVGGKRKRVAKSYN